jgi:hypothetical protein
MRVSLIKYKYSNLSTAIEFQNGKQELYSDGQQLLDDILKNKELKG